MDKKKLQKLDDVKKSLILKKWNRDLKHMLSISAKHHTKTYAIPILTTLYNVVRIGIVYVLVFS